MIPFARSLACLLAACVASFAATATATGAPSPDRLDPAEVHALERDLAERERCYAIELLIPSWRCERVDPAPSETTALVDALGRLSALDAVAAYQRETGERSRAIGACMVGVSVHVRAILRDRASQPSGGRDEASGSQPREVTAPGWNEWLCDGVELPGFLEANRILGRDGACGFTVDDATGIDAPALLRCIETLTTSRLAAAGIGPRPRRPNVVVILTDDQRWDTIDATHSPSPQGDVPAMPVTFGRLAGEGITFTQAVVTTPICGPSRGSFFSGLYSHRHGMMANRGKLGAARFDDSDTFATRFDAAGYRTGFLGKYTNGFTDLWAHGVDEPYIPPGWDVFKAFDHAQGVPQTRFSMVENGETVSYDTDDRPYSSDILARHALAFIDAAAADSAEAPFALWISTSAPHFPWNPAARHVGAFEQVEFVLYPSTYEADVSDKPPWIRSRPLPASLITLDAAQRLRKKQLEMNLSVDEMVAAILDRLDLHGMGDDTIIVYASDNGQGWGEHRWESKSCPWEECLKVPMLLRYPRLVPGPRSEGGVMSSVDLLPTLLGLAEADVPRHVDGVDLSEVIRGFEEMPERDVLFESYTGFVTSYTGVRRDGLKYFRYVDGSEVLHDLEADPWELENFANRPEYASIRAEMKARLEVLRPGS